MRIVVAAVLLLLPVFQVHSAAQGSVEAREAVLGKRERQVPGLPRHQRRGRVRARSGRPPAEPGAVLPGRA